MLRVHAFLALITAAIVVSLLAPGDPLDKIGRVAMAFGTTAGKIGIVIAMAAIIGRCLIDSGAADRIVRAFVRFLGEDRCPVALMSSGFVLSIPVFFDTVFYLLLPLARSMHRRTGKNFLFLVLVMGAGASITHSLVPPTPGPLLISEILGVDIGVMILVGLLLGLCTAAVMLPFTKKLARYLDIPMRPIDSSQPEPEPIPDDKLPGLLVSSLPILLPVVLITLNTVVSTLAGLDSVGSWVQSILSVTSILGNANFAMLLSAAVALAVLKRQRGLDRRELTGVVDGALMSGGVIILITSAGGAFGAMLKVTEIGPAVESLFSTDGGGGLGGIQLLLLAYFVAFLIKFAQGSSTVAMITSAAMLAPLMPTDGSLAYNPVYLAAAIGFGAQCGNWMNDSGFWIIAKMSGLTEVETLKSWTVTVSSLAFVGLFFTIVFSWLMPLV